MSSAIAFEEAGPARPWLVLVHGMSQDHRVFDKQVQAFRGDYRVLLIDLPGHGLAVDLVGPYGHMELADHVLAVLDERDISTAHYWGTHTGTAIGMLIVCRQPDRFASLILEGPVLPGQNMPVTLTAFTKTRQIAIGDGLPAAIESWWSTSCWFENMRADPDACRAAQHRAILADFAGRPWIDDRTPAPVDDVSALLPDLRTPTLIYNGDLDHPEFLAESERLAAMLPNGRQALIPAAGGFPAWERPDSVNGLVADFLPSSGGSS